MKIETQQNGEHQQDCLLAITREATKFGDVTWVVWYNNEVLAEELSAEAALGIARAIITGC